MAGFRIDNKDALAKELEADKKAFKKLNRKVAQIVVANRNDLKRNSFVLSGALRRLWKDRKVGKSTYHIFNDRIAHGLQEKYLAEFHNTGRRVKTSKGRRWKRFIDKSYDKFSKLLMRETDKVIIRRV